ncbi:hypothetical protein BACCAP_01014 [Pseudoflavonifractor capillosus ATCC 29799]|uniref:Uncharacterized protein n=1 Tax=Pseudoflavonifractor capillosus ATCC 29799 TaxID=411467 RepID=A6NS37_9FIRM|nr:hypothetical protein BACCAP_01014 [Pseudoflavonifractor capillosus ATCC 29799]
MLPRIPDKVKAGPGRQLQHRLFRCSLIKSQSKGNHPENSKRKTLEPFKL